jgi:hypothetical protein
MTLDFTTNSNEDRIHLLTTKMFPVLEWFEVMKKEELDEYCHLVTKGTPKSERIWNEIVKIYYKIYLREKLYGATEYGYQH